MFKAFRIMAVIVFNENSTRLLISFSFLLVLTIVNSSTDVGTVELLTSSSFPGSGTEQQPTTSSYADNETMGLLTSSSYPGNGTEQQPTTSSYADNETMGPLTSSSYPDNGTEQQPTTSSYPDSGTENQFTSSPFPDRTGQRQLFTSSPDQVNVTERPMLRLLPNNGTHLHLNEPTLETICTNSSLQVHMNFSRPYDGVTFANEFSHNTSCSILTHPSSKATDVVLELLFNTCGNRMRAVNAGVYVYNTIVIQQHRMIPTRLDSVRNVSCVLAGASIETFRPFVNPATTRPRKAVLRLENSIGTDLFPSEHFRPSNFSESALYVVVRMSDMPTIQDMVVRNCIAHDQRIISNQTNLYQLSNFYGCPDNSSLFGDFTVTNETYEQADLMAYAMIRNFTFFANAQLYITCGVNLCVDVCQPKCEEDESERYRQFSRVVVKKIVQRPVGATTPSTLRLFTEDSERVKRSVSDIFSNMFHASKSFLGNIVQENLNFSMLEAFTEEATLSDLDDKQNETVSTNMETITSSIFLDEGIQSTVFEVINVSTETYLQEKASYLKNEHVDKPKARQNVSGDILPMASEIFVCVLFCVLFGLTFCFACKTGRK